MGRTCSYFYPRDLYLFEYDSPTIYETKQKALMCDTKINNNNKKALFGGYPTQEQVHLLETLGVKWFVDLTLGNEKRTKPYVVTNKDKYINYPIVDQHVPFNITSFVKFIKKLISVINGLTENDKLYIHCKGGHGRSGLVAATLLCAMDKISPKKAIEEITISHNQRYMMKRKWKKIGSPQTRDQCNFLHSLFESQNIDNDPLLSLSSKHPITFPCTTIIFKTVNDAVYYLMKTKEYYLMKTKERNNAFMQCVEFILDMKFEQHSDCKEYLLETGFKQLKSTQNCAGTICIKLRNKYYSRIIN